MKTITVSNGDIQLNNGKIQFSIGSQKLVEDLTRWLEEPIGTGFTTPGFGSLLLNSVGQSQNVSSTSTIENEISRVLQLYQGQQVYNLQNAHNSSQLANWNKGEIIQQIVSIKATVYDSTITANIQLLTLKNDPVNLMISIDNNGVTVQNG